MKYELGEIIGENHQRRGVVFLVSKEDDRVTAKDAFESLDKNSERFLRRNGFDAWQSGLTNKRVFHGWNKSQYDGKYVNCFVFKVKIKRVHHRFFGFICHPKKDNQRYELCVLVRHATKDTWEADETELKHVKELSNTLAVIQVVHNYFKGKK